METHERNPDHPGTTCYFTCTLCLDSAPAVQGLSGPRGLRELGLWEKQAVLASGNTLDVTFGLEECARLADSPSLASKPKTVRTVLGLAQLSPQLQGNGGHSSPAFAFIFALLLPGVSPYDFCKLGGNLHCLKEWCNRCTPREDVGVHEACSYDEYGTGQLQAAGCAEHFQCRRLAKKPIPVSAHKTSWCRMPSEERKDACAILLSKGSAE